MRKVGIIAGIACVLVFGLFFWLLGAAGPDNAPTDVRTIDVTPAP